MTATQIVEELRALGTPGYKKILLNHGIPEPLFGVKVEHLKQYQKRIKRDQPLAMALYATGIYDAMYLAGLIAEPEKMTKPQLRGWLRKANCEALCGFVVSAIAAESRHGWELALEWIDSSKPLVASAGWTTLSGLVSITDDAELDLDALKRLLERVRKTIHDQPDRVRYAMNGFVIALGCCVKPLSQAAMKAAEQIGEVSVDMGDTACKVPYAPDAIRKVADRGAVGRKRKGARC